ncbi:MAG TPA: hypothetical protein VHE55_03710 [Fimbriimonadaceae bacterium]|nr:hypothetical protein [Fimbriimonadaceae bacterium]
MRANFMLLAQYAGQILNGGPIISNVFRFHRVPNFPAPFEAFVALELEIDPHEVGRHEFLLRIIDEDGIPLREAEMVAEFRARPTLGPNYVYATPRLSTLVRRPGLHRLDLIYKDEVIAQRTFEVVGPDGAEQ